MSDLAVQLFAKHDPRTVWTVTEVANYLTQVVHADFPNYFWLCGELVLNEKQSNNPHFYATLRDETGSTIPVVWFNGTARIRQMDLKSGDRVFAYGHLDIYSPRCTLQFMAQKIQRADGEETLTELMRRSLAKLAAEGLTDPSRKKPIPPFPQRIGIVTSPDAAGYRDFLHTCLSRFPRLTFVLAPSKVQGNAAVPELIQAVKMLDEYGKCDLIVVTRGGGSITDLWCFNDESLARTIAAAKTPIITAIGHERDTTLVDYVSDLNAITPTKAAEIVTQNLFLATQALESYACRIANAMQWLRQNRRLRLEKALSAQHLTHPLQLVADRKTRLANDELRLYSALPHRAEILRSTLDILWQRLLDRQTSDLEHASAQLKTLQTALRTLDPKGVLKRGYSILLDEQQHAIRQPAEAPAGTKLTALLGRGKLKVTVDE